MSAGRTNVNQVSTDWCTPPKYVEAINKFFDGYIALDPCSNDFSTVEAETKFALPATDGLSAKWDFKTIFVNPPYGADRIRGTTIKDWFFKCEEAHRIYKSEVLALVPVATNTRHWKDYVFGKAAGICFLYDTRLRFQINGHLDEKGAPMSCAMIYWGRNISKFIETFSPYGAALDVSQAIGEKFGYCENVAEKQLVLQYA